MVATTAERRAPVLPTAWRRNINLTRELAWTQFKLKYAGSVLGYVWATVKPAMQFGVLYLIFGVIFRETANEFAVQLLVGIVFFNFFTECTGSGMTAIAGNGDLVRKAFFPRALLVVSTSVSAALTFLINIVLIVVVAALLGHLHPGLRSLWVIPLVVELYALSLGVGLLLASVYVYYRDLGHIWDVLTQVLFYGSAIVFPLIVRVHTVALRRLVLSNPLAQIVEDVRHALVIDRVSTIPHVPVPWTVDVNGPLLLVPLGISVGLLALGVLVFRRLSPNFAERL